MKSTTPRKSNNRRCILGLLLIGATAPRFVIGEATKSKSKLKSGIEMNKNFWQVVENLTKKIPFKKDSLEEFLGASLMEKRKTANTVFYEGHSIKLKDGSVIEKIDLRIGLEQNHPGFLVLDLSGTCFTLDNVHSHFGPTSITQVPSGQSIDEPTVHTSMQSWGALSFGFRESNPNCLAYVAFAPEKY